MSAVLLPADLIFCHGSSWLSSAIRWATRGKGEAKTYANHVGGIVSGPGTEFHLSRILEALWTVQEHPLSDLEPGSYQIWRHMGLTDLARANVAAAAASYLGREYGGAKLLTHLGDALLAKAFGGNPYVFRRVNHRQEYPVCDWIWSHTYKRGAGYTFGCEPAATTPDLMHDWVKRHSDHWRRVL